MFKSLSLIYYFKYFEFLSKFIFIRDRVFKSSLALELKIRCKSMNSLKFKNKGILLKINLHIKYIKIDCTKKIKDQIFKF